MSRPWLGCFSAALLALAMTFTATSSTSAATSAADVDPGTRAITVQDSVADAASHLNISRARFANSTRSLKLVATHPHLVGYWVHWYKFFIKNKNRQYYALFLGPKRKKRLLYFGTEEEGGKPVRCRGIKVSIRDASLDAGSRHRDGRVVMRIPQRCLHGTARVRFAYTVFTAGLNDSDAIPGGSTGPHYSRWVRRG